MIQPEDNRTIPLPLGTVTEKRGRGRPRKEGALTNAQRQAAYRVRHKTDAKTVTVTKNIPAAADGYDELVIEADRLREELAAARAEALRLQSELQNAREVLRRPVGHKWSYRQVTAAAEAAIRRYAVSASQYPAVERLTFGNWAYGAVGVWSELTMGWMADGDRARLEGLFDSLVTDNEK